MNRPLMDLFDEIAWIGQQCFEFVDLALGSAGNDLDEPNADAVRAVLEEHNLGAVVQTASHLPLGSPFEAFRQDASDELRRYLKVAHRIGAGALSTHFTYPYKSSSIDDVVAWHVEILAPLCEDAAEIGIKVLLANASHGGHQQLDSILAIMDEVRLLSFQLSSGHAKLDFEHDRLDDYLNRFGSRLTHVQLSDTNGSADQHLPLGSVPRSTINWPQHIRQLKRSGYDGTITLKVFSPEHEYLLLSRHLLQKWWREA